MRALLLCALLAAAPAWAQSYGYYGRSGMDGYDVPLPATPDRMLRQGIDRLTGFMMGPGAASPPLVRRFLDAQIAPYFDFGYMARWAAGGYYRRLDARQRGQLAADLHDLFLGALARNLGAYARPLPEVEVYRARPGNTPYETVVPARVMLPVGSSIMLLFRCYYGPRGWRVFDVSADGASAVAFYRSYFTDRFRRLGLAGALAPPR